VYLRLLSFTCTILYERDSSILVGKKQNIIQCWGNAFYLFFFILFIFFSVLSNFFSWLILETQILAALKLMPALCNKMHQF